MAPRVVSSRLTNFFTLLAQMKASEYFDANWYRSQSFGARFAPSALVHYLFFGWRKGLNPSPRFDTRFYIARYRDVEASKANPLKHYLIHGHQEGRLATRSGRIFREYLVPEFSPLPLFGAPAESQPRLSVVLDDHTPRILGLGYSPVLSLAAQVALASGWSLRIVIRSRVITTEEVSHALGLGPGSSRPRIDITRREPGPTDDVETVPDDTWWATSASSYESLRHLVPASALWWLMAADESAREGAGEYAELVRTLLSLRDTRVIALGESVAAHVPRARLAHTVKSLPLNPGPRPGKKTSGRKTQGTHSLGVIIAPGHPESLPASTVTLLEECLTRGTLDPSRWTIRLIGVEWEPLTLSGSVVVEQRAPQNPSDWLEAIGSVDALVSIQSGTEHPWLVDVASHTGIGTATLATTKAVAAALASRRSPASARPDWATIAGAVGSAMESLRG